MDVVFSRVVSLVPRKGPKKKREKGSGPMRDYNPAIHTHRPVACRIDATTKPSLWEESHPQVRRYMHAPETRLVEVWRGLMEIGRVIKRSCGSIHLCCTHVWSAIPESTIEVIKPSISHALLESHPKMSYFSTVNDVIDQPRIFVRSLEWSVKKIGQSENFGHLFSQCKHGT